MNRSRLKRLRLRKSPEQLQKRKERQEKRRRRREILEGVRRDRERFYKFKNEKRQP